jgi:hypothetical protein
MLNRCLVLVARVSIYSGKRRRLPCTPGSKTASSREAETSGQGITTVDHIFRELCCRYHTAPEVARLAPLDADASGLKFTMGDVVAEQSIARLTTMLTKAIDREVVLMLLDPGD